MSEITNEAVRTDLIEQAATIVARYPEGRSRSALLPMLHLVQSVDGYVSPAGIAFCAEQLGITKAEVAAVATFYTMYKRRPTGEYLVSVCTNTMCGVLGGDKAYEALSQYLEVGHDQTTEDGKITLEHAECLAACDYAPVMTVNYEYFDQVDEGSALTLVKQLQDGERPMPTRGAGLCSFKQMSRQLAGFDDNRNSVADAMIGVEPTVAGNRIAEERGVSVPGYYPNTPIPRKADKDAAPAPAKAAAPAPAAPAPAAPAPAAPAPDAAPAAGKAAPAAETPAGAASADKAATAATADGPKSAEPPAALIPVQPASEPAAPSTPAAKASADDTKSADNTTPADKASAGETGKPAPRTRRRTTGPTVSATAEPSGRRPANKAPAKRATRRPGTERSAPAVEQAPTQPAQPATEPQVRDVETPENPAETSPTVPEPAIDSKPAGDASPTDPRTANAEGDAE